MLRTPGYWPPWQLEQFVEMPLWFIVHVLKVVVDVWHPLQSRLDGLGMCAVVGGSVTIVTPKKVLPEPWHVAQVVLATGAWFIAVPEKFVNFAGAWHVSHAALPIGMCVAGGVTIVTPKNVLPDAWQLAQPDVMPAWFIVPPPKLVNFVGEWQSSHGWEVGTCVAGGATGTTLANDEPLA